jgi:hypothetical protein
VTEGQRGSRLLGDMQVGFCQTVRGVYFKRCHSR